jgi:peptide/nickel transport system permease protein
MSSPQQTTAADDGLLILVETHRTTSRSERIRALALYIALAAVVTLGVVGIAIQLIPSTRHLYIEQDLTATFLPPLSPGHPLGTDNLGRDLGWRIVAGLGVSLTAGLAVALISSVLGLIGGILGAFYGRTADTVASVSIDVCWAFPAILLAVVLAGALGPGMVPVILGISLTGWAAIARIVRGEVLSLREREYVAAAQALGVSRFRVSLRHLLPNLLPVTIVLAASTVAYTMVAEAGLSFLGLGAQPPTPSIGVIMSEGRNFLEISWWPVVLSGMTLAVVVLLFNTIGDDVRDRLDPHGQHQA